MARPKPTIILEHTDNQTYRSEQVLKATAVYSVFYKSLTFLKYIQKCISKTNKFDLKLKYKSNFQTKLEFKSLYMLDSSNSIQPSFSGVNTITYKSQNKMFRLFKVFLQLNLYTNTHVYKTHMT